MPARMRGCVCRATWQAPRETGTISRCLLVHQFYQTPAEASVWIDALWNIRDVVRPSAMDALRQRGLDEGVDFTVEHGGRVGALHARAQILHDLIGLEHIGADLMAPADLG